MTAPRVAGAADRRPGDGAAPCADGFGDGSGLVDLDRWLRPPEEIDADFDRLRSTGRPFVPEPDVDGLGAGPGSYALTSHRDVSEVSRRRDCFASGEIDDVDEVASTRQRRRILSRARGRPTDGFEDDAAHARMRRITSRSLTPRRIRELRAAVDAVAADVVDDICERGSFDLVTQVAARMPVLVLLDLLGLPRSEERLVSERANVVLGLSDPTVAPDRSAAGIVDAALRAGDDLARLVDDVAQRRRADPRDDLISALVHDTTTGAPLDAAQIASFAIVLLVAGSETTRNAITHGVLALADHPEQRAAWLADVEAITPTAVEEVIRYSTPISHFRRTVVRDGTRLGDLELAIGDKVVLWYRAANRDGAVFADPGSFDVRRTPNEHVGFGAPGAHFCLGANLARVEIAAMLVELMRRMPDLAPEGPPRRLRSNFVNGISRQLVSCTPTARRRR